MDKLSLGLMSMAFMLWMMIFYIKITYNIHQAVQHLYSQDRLLGENEYEKTCRFLSELRRVQVKWGIISLSLIVIFAVLAIGMLFGGSV